MTPLELALLLVGSVMVGGVFGWIGYCLARCWYGRSDKND